MSKTALSQLDRIQGCLVGGAVGDALGYPVEFMSYESIRDAFGPAGIRSYWLERTGRVARFSDDTQMTLFTAAGLLERATQRSLRGSAGSPAAHIYRAYLDWLYTQDYYYDGNPRTSFLVDVPALQVGRAPGNTCLSALRSGKMGTIEQTLNRSKGCGGVMRVAPLGLVARDLEEPWRHAAEAAAITHGHPMGYIPAAVLARLVELGTYGGADTLQAAVELCCEDLPSWFESQRAYAEDMTDQLRRAARLAAGDAPDHECVVQLGEGWVGDEALAIAVYCCLRHPQSFDDAVVAAVNHGGDSDSTGAIAGNILGAWLGLSAIGPQWTAALEQYDLLMEVGRDLCDACATGADGVPCDSAWLARWGRALGGGGEGLVE